MWGSNNLVRCLSALAIVALSGCSAAVQQPSISFGSRNLTVPGDLSPVVIAAQDIGDSALASQGFVGESANEEKEAVLSFVTLDQQFPNARSLEQAVTASNTRLLGYRQRSQDVISFSCGDGTQDAVVTRFSFQRSPFTAEEYVVTQAYLADGEKTAVISYLALTNALAKDFFSTFREITCI